MTEIHTEDVVTIQMPAKPALENRKKYMRQVRRLASMLEGLSWPQFNMLYQATYLTSEKMKKVREGQK